MYTSTDYSTNYSTDYTVFGAIIAFLLAIMAVLVIYSLISYLLIAVGLYRIAQRKGMKNAWMAWVPWVQTYLYAETIGKTIRIGRTEIPNFPVFYVLIIYGGSFLSYVLNTIPILGALLSLILIPALLIARIYVVFRFFKQFLGNNAVLYTVLAVLVPFAHPILVLVLREKPFAETSGLQKM